MQNHGITQTLYVPIDVGKNVHCYGIYRGSELEEVDAPQEMRTDQANYERFRARLRELLNSDPLVPVVVGLEPTGIYHEPWAYQLQRDFGAALELRLVNPFRTRQKRRQMHNRAEQKTDPLDVLALAHCLRDGNGHRFQMSEPAVEALNLWCRQHAALRKDRQRLGNRLRDEMDRLWPGSLVDVRTFKRAHPTLLPPEPLVATQPFHRKLVQTLIRLNPDPYVWCALSTSQIQDRLRTAGMRCGPKTAQKVARVAHNAPLLPRQTTRMLAEMLQQEYARYQGLQVEIDSLLLRCENLVQSLPGAAVSTIPGLSLFQAAQYGSVVGDADRFDHADQVWALVGLDVVQNDSGDRRQRGKITKRGGAYERAVLYQMGHSASMACPVIERAKQRALQRGKCKVVATIHAAHKTNRICFHLYKTGVAYDPAKAR